MKIATFNINNVNKRLANLLDWLRSAKPDVVALQELKAPDAEFPAPAIERAGYGAVWRGQKSWNGVAILARGCEPIVTRTQLPGERADAESRYIEAAVRGVLIASLYAPNGNPQPGPKFAYKLAWMKRLAAHAEELYGADIPVVLAGDYNVVPTDRDIYPHPMRRTPCSSRRAARFFNASSTKGGSMQSARFIPTRRCTRSGTICETAGRETRG